MANLYVDMDKSYDLYISKTRCKMFLTILLMFSLISYLIRKDVPDFLANTIMRIADK